MVSFDERYGTTSDILARGSVSALMTLPSAESDWLIVIASARVSSIAPDFLARSEPARSTRLILEKTRLRVADCA